MNIEELIKKDREIPDNFATDAFKALPSFERFSILLKLEELRLLSLDVVEGDANEQA